MAAHLEPFLLNNGHHMPRIGLGTHSLKDDEGRKVIISAIETGYRMIDTALAYGNEPEIGDAVKKAVDCGMVKREDLFIITKVPPSRLAPSDVKLSVDESLSNLKLKYIDLLLIHSPWALKNHGDGNLKPMAADGFYDYENLNLAETWKAFEEVVAEGKVNSIGLSNFTEKQLRTVLKECNIKPQVIQFECHAYYQQQQLSQFCLQNGIHCIAYGPLGAPGISAKHVTPELANIRLLKDPLVIAMSEKYQKTPAQILLRFLVQINFSMVPKTCNIERLKENIDVADFEISEEDLKALRTLDCGTRFYNYLSYSRHKEFPKTGEFY